MFGFTNLDRLQEAAFGSRPARARVVTEEASSAVQVSALSNWQYGTDDGEKFAGGFGPTQFLQADYWTLRARSAELFERNLYARGLIRRLITNEINVGLHLEATPEELLLGYPEDGLADWSETTENRFALWSASPRLCDFTERATFGALQAQARMEALVAGDVLVMLQQDPRTRLPRIRLVNGAAVQTPLGHIDGFGSSGTRIVHGVELDTNGRHVAYWIRQRDGSSKRLPAYGEKSGRRLAWLVYGTDRRLDEVRGKPILSLVLQSLKEIDRYRDSTQRKAVINAMLAMFIKRTAEKSASSSLTKAGIRTGNDKTIDTTGKERTFKASEWTPGVTIEGLEVGEEPTAFQSNGTTESFGVFEEAIIQSVAWANEIPPEVLRLSFSSNYSASKAANNEFEMYLTRKRSEFGDNFCQPIYIEWLLSEVLAQRIEAPRLVESWRDMAQFDTFGAWVYADWTGHIKPSIDMTKQVAAYVAMVENGFITRDRATRELTGQKYSKNVDKLGRENPMLAAANKTLAEQKNPPEARAQESDDNKDPDGKPFIDPDEEEAYGAKEKAN
jgi:lambda family phage portal protein